METRDVVGLEKLAARLFPVVKDAHAFIDALSGGEIATPAIVIVRENPAIKTFPTLAPQPWQPDWVLRLSDDFYPGRHPLHDSGHYYCMDSSSAFAASAMLAIRTPPKRILDMCSAPGGKGIFSKRAFPEAELFANEVIRKRCGMLIENLSRCKIEPSRVVSADPGIWAKYALGAMDLVLVDAPCSGQSLLVKGSPVPGAFDAALVRTNASRQRRILANAAKALAPQGHLLYMTCTFSLEENEENVEWLLREFPELESVPVPHLAQHLSPHSEAACYRLYPQSGVGAGAFCALLRNKVEVPTGQHHLSSIRHVWTHEDGPPAKRRQMASDAPPSRKGKPPARKPSGRKSPRRPRR